jgi:RNA polymerase sigma-70 factor (ECF subfamily)
MDLRLSAIATRWTVVSQANQGAGPEAGAAQQAVLDRYGGAIRRYLAGAARDPDAADELYQEFAYRLLNGDLRGADRRRGRFRDFVKGVLFHLVADYHARKQRQPRPLPPDYAEAAVESVPLAGEEEAFLTSWRDELLARSWAALAEIEKASGQSHYTVLRFRADHPDLASGQMADRLGPVLNRRLTAAGVRQALHRAREKFADLLLDEVARDLDDPTPEHLEDELNTLGLLDHCRPALERRGRSTERDSPASPSSLGRERRAARHA